jgi:hypothetical protein
MRCVLRQGGALVSAALIATACSKSRDTDPPPSPADDAAVAPEALPTVAGLFARGAPVFVAGTAGDDAADQRVAAQVALMRGFVPGSTAVDDTAIDVAKGPAGWPANPVVYGGPHVNRAVAAIAPSLPFELAPGRLAIGGRVFEGDVQLTAAIPARAAAGGALGHPAFVLYAGTGTPGIGEINAVGRGDVAIAVVDRFGILVTGMWRRGADGALAAELSAPAHRLEWRKVERAIAAGGNAAAIAVRVWFLVQLPARDDEAAVVDACVRGIERVAGALALAAPGEVDIYVYPDRGSKRSLTGDAGDGHAAVDAHALHVLPADTSPGGLLEGLIAHEGTHVLAYQQWGGSGSPLLGEGLAVWVAGHYAGTPLAAWKSRVRAPDSVASLLGAGFRNLPEAEGYPIAGLFVGAAIGEVGAAKFRVHLLGAGAATWDDACARAGTTASALDAALAASIRD